MEILFINDDCSLIFDRLETGASVRTTLFIKALANLGHVNIISFYKDELKSNIGNCDIIINANVTEPKARKSYRGKKWVDQFFRPMNPYTYFPLESEKEKLIDGHCRTHTYDFIACRYFRNAVRYGLLKYNDKLIIDLDDNPADAHKIVLSDSASLPFYKRWRLSIQGHTIGSMVRKSVRRTFCTFHSNPLEKVPRNSVLLYNTTVIEGGVEDIDDSTPFRMLMVGNLDYSPNTDGSLHFAEKVFPSIKAAVRDAEFHIAGKCSDPSLVERLNAVTGVSTLGYIDDIKQEYRNSRVIIIPIYKGSGTSIKFIEGFMMNRPVVSSPIGARGFESISREGENFLLAKDDDDFAMKTIHLLQDVGKSREIAGSALVAARKHFSQEGFISKVRETVIKAAESKGKR